MKVVAALFALGFSAGAYGTVTINGKTYSCNGSLSVINGKATCNGVDLDSGSSSGPCGGSKTRKAVTGSGQIDVRANVPDTARVDGTICGNTTLDKSSIVQKGALINGDFNMGKNAIVRRGANLNGRGRLGENAVIGEGANLNGNINVVNSEVAPGTNLNGDINLDGIKMSGDISCSGSGTISTQPPADSAR